MLLQILHSSLPYKDRLGNDHLLISDLPVHLTVKKLTGEDEIECLLCHNETSKKFKLKDMRSHVGKHILFEFRNIAQFSTLKPGAVIGLDPCGWCGRDGCLTQLSKKGNTLASPIVTSSCEYHYGKMAYGRAATCSQSSPCSNVPIHCPVCPMSVSGQPRTI